MASRLLFSACALTIALALPGCGTSYTSSRVADPTLMATAHSPAEVRAAIIRAMENRKFTAKAEEPGQIFAKYERGDQRLEVAIEYSETQYRVKYVSSDGMKTKPGANGDVLVDARWQGWAKGLNARIGEELLVPAKEAAEVARREREYQLLLEQHRTAQAQAQANAQNGGGGGNAGNTVGGVIGAIAPLVPQTSIELSHKTTTTNNNTTTNINRTNTTISK